jgi:precorrin-6A/cobalt-precorrin-6A reductase
MILLLGGTGATAQIAMGLAQAGYCVLVSRATDVPLDVGQHARIESRCGPLDETGLTAMLVERKIQAVVDATHPYATTIRATAQRVAGRLGIPYLSFLRPPVLGLDEAGVEYAADHAAAAATAFAHGRPVLLTTGSRNLAPYAEQSRRTGLPLVVRVLDRPQSHEACRQAGIPAQRVVTGRGPFSVEENRRQIRAFGIGVLVTKDGGRPGGALEKLQAGRAECCRLVVVGRPQLDAAIVFTEVEALLSFLSVTI